MVIGRLDPEAPRMPVSNVRWDYCFIVRAASKTYFTTEAVEIFTISKRLGLLGHGQSKSNGASSKSLTAISFSA